MVTPIDTDSNRKRHYQYSKDRTRNANSNSKANSTATATVGNRHSRRVLCVRWFAVASSVACYGCCCFADGFAALGPMFGVRIGVGVGARRRNNNHVIGILASLPASESIPESIPKSIPAPFFVPDIDNAKPLTGGSRTLPPMTSVPCSIANANGNGNIAAITELVKPPGVEELYDWYRTTKLRREPDADPSWGVLWPTAVSLANYLLLVGGSDNDSGVGAGAGAGAGVVDNDTNANDTANANIVRDKTVIELGAGLGLCGLTAAALGAKSVLLTDREPYALHCALATAACNGFSATNSNTTTTTSTTTSTSTSTTTSTIEGAVLDWCDVVETNKNGSGNDFKFDLLLASDVLYDGETIEAFAGACKKLVNVNNNDSDNNSDNNSNNNSAILLVSDPKRERFPGARETLKTALLRRTNHDDANAVGFRVLDLPPPPVVGTVPANTMDGRDHEQRMQEPTVLIEVVFGPSVGQRRNVV
mmetsp:Transcript_1886/g.3807  ORF Transcript_1886/g.3807 Transcript_1886/m.3807 type:complete len:477 (-) Transcript_1886:155-1585(-)